MKLPSLRPTELRAPGSLLGASPPPGPDRRPHYVACLANPKFASTPSHPSLFSNICFIALLHAVRLTSCALIAVSYDRSCLPMSTQACRASDMRQVCTKPAPSDKKRHFSALVRLIATSLNLSNFSTWQVELRVMNMCLSKPDAVFAIGSSDDVWPRRMLCWELFV